MEDLRWLLLIFGLLAIAGVYLYSRKEKKASDTKPASTDRVAPSLDGSEQDDEPPRDSEDHINDASVEDPDDEPTQQESPQKIVTVRIVAHEQASFAGDELVLSMRGIGLQHGEFGIFHRLDGDEEGRTIFSAASLIEPGSFDLQNIKGQEIPGISLFLVLPGPVECIEAFDMMLAAARILTQSLNGELLDESGSTLSTQRERYLREEIIQFQHSNLVA